ncbi:MAG: HAD hydrolase-like protein, partial [Ruminococcus sp.]|nr:HAD hydrolase-like protein [Ruminococcus sp.]
MIKMVIFDLDGTLVDSLTDLALNVNKGLRAVGLPEHPVERYRTFVGNGREMLVKRAMGEASGDAEKYDTVVRVFNEEYAVHYNDNTAAYEGCDAMLHELASRGI